MFGWNLKEDKERTRSSFRVRTQADIEDRDIQKQKVISTSNVWSLHGYLLRGSVRRQKRWTFRRWGEVERAREKRTKSTPVSWDSTVMLWKTRENEIVQQNEMSQHSESFRKTKRKCFTRKGSFLVYNPMRFLAVPLPFIFSFEANLSLFVYSSLPSLLFSCHFSLRRTGWRVLNIPGVTLHCHCHGSVLRSAFLRIWVGSTVGTVKV